MKYLLDVNGLVALGFLQHEFHERVRWLGAYSGLKGSPGTGNLFDHGTWLRPGPRTGTAVWIHHRPRTHSLTPPQRRKYPEVYFHPRRS